jgi:hypothetical protein
MSLAYPKYKLVYNKNYWGEITHRDSSELSDDLEKLKRIADNDKYLVEIFERTGDKYIPFDYSKPIYSNKKASYVETLDEYKAHMEAYKGRGF